MPSIIRAVAFDLDGTLIDSTDAIVQSFVHTFQSLGERPPSRESIVNTISVVLPEQFRLLAARHPEESVRVYREHYAKTATPMTRTLEGVPQILNALRSEGLPLAVVTSKSRPMAEMLLRDLGIGGAFAFCIGPEDVARPKPDAEPIRAAVERFSVHPSRMLYVGDTEFDIQAARAAGVPCWCVTTGYRTAEQLRRWSPDAVYSDMCALSAALLAAIRPDHPEKLLTDK